MNKIIFLLTFIFCTILTYSICAEKTLHELKWEVNHLLYQANLTEVKIPKIIHYVWVGSDEPESVKRTIVN